MQSCPPNGALGVPHCQVELMSKMDVTCRRSDIDGLHKMMVFWKTKLWRASVPDGRTCGPAEVMVNELLNGTFQGSGMDVGVAVVEVRAVVLDTVEMTNRDLEVLVGTHVMAAVWN
jgi:hypothetical protein